MDLARVTLILAVAMLAGSTAANEPASELDVVLERLARVADLYRDRALSSTCDESIYFTGTRHSAVRKFQYIYRRDESGNLQDYREPRRRSRSAEAGRVSLQETGFPEMLLRPYSWVFVFDREERESYRFELDGEERVGGRPTLRVRFRARRATPTPAPAARGSRGSRSCSR